MKKRPFHHLGSSGLHDKNDDTTSLRRGRRLINPKNMKKTVAFTSRSSSNRVHHHYGKEDFEAENASFSVEASNVAAAAVDAAAVTKKAADAAPSAEVIMMSTKTTNVIFRKNSGAITKPNPSFAL